MNPPKIFISATSADLSSARQIAKEALLTINCHPVEQTNFEPDWRSVTDMLRGKISDCQALIHLVGFRYGAEPDPASLPGSTPRRSYTQMEYHLARELGLRVYTFLLPETYPFDVPAKADTPEQTRLQAAHRALIQSSPHLYEKPANNLDLRTRIIALQEKVMGLEQEQQSIAHEVKATRHWGVWAAAAIVLILGGIGVWQWRGQSQLASQVQVVSQKQDEQTNLLKDQSNLLREAVIQLEELTEEKARLGIKITDLPREVVEKELAARVGVSAVELRLNIEAGKKSQDALTRAHANLLAGKLDDAHAAAKEVRDAEAPAIQRIIESLQVDGQAYAQEVKYEAALESYQKAAALVDKTSKPLAWADAQSSAALILGKLARYQESEFLRREILRLQEAHFGTNHAETSTALNNLAVLLQSLNRTEEAETLLRRALKIDEGRFGLDHLDVAAELINLAHLLYVTNRLPEAEGLLNRALKICEASSNQNSQYTAIAIGNLAALLQATNRPDEAETLMRRALKIGETNFGPDHPAVAIRLGNLAQLLQATDRAEEAKPLMERALKINEASYGPKHPTVARDLNNLASLLYARNLLTEAEPLMRRALEIDEVTYGPDHPNVARGLSNLAALLTATKRPAEAEQMLRRALKIDEASFGPNHPDVAIRISNLAVLLTAANRYDEAEPLMQRALKIDETNLGPEHPDVAISRHNLAHLLQARNRLQDAEPLMRQAVGSLFHVQAKTAHRHQYSIKFSSNYLILAREMNVSDIDIHARLDRLRQDAGLDTSPFELIWQEVLAANPAEMFQVVITEVVKGGQGEALGLQAGDAYVSYNGQAITSKEQFIRLVGEAEGEAIPLDVVRAGKKLNFTAKSGKLGTVITNSPPPSATGAAPAK